MKKILYTALLGCFFAQVSKIKPTQKIKSKQARKVKSVRKATLKKDIEYIPELQLFTATTKNGNISLSFGIMTHPEAGNVFKFKIDTPNPHVKDMRQVKKEMKSIFQKIWSKKEKIPGAKDITTEEFAVVCNNSEGINEDMVKLMDYLRLVVPGFSGMRQGNGSKKSMNIKSIKM